MSQELKTDLQEVQRQRRPEELRDKDFTSRIKVEKKPTPEDLARVEQAKKLQRFNQLEQLQAQFNQFPIHLLKGEEVEHNIKTVNKSFELLSKNIENEEAFNRFLRNTQEKLAKIKIEADKALHSVYSQQSFLSTVPPLTLEETKGIQKEIKVQAQQQIDAQETKEQSRLERPNASPIATIEDDEGRTEEKEEKEEKTSFYVFSTILKHTIIQNLQQTSTEDSSYSGIKINRERLQNFVQFLQNEERKKRRNEGEQLQDSDDLGYYFDPAQGKGSHLKLKFGRGIKSITLSRQGGNFLTVEQLRDIKNALILKGLVTLKK